MKPGDWFKGAGGLLFWLLAFWKPKPKPKVQTNFDYSADGWAPVPCPKCGKPAVNDYQAMDGSEYGYYCNACKFAFTVKR